VPAPTVRAGTATLVILMGVSKPQEITDQAVDAGADVVEPVVVVEPGSAPQRPPAPPGHGPLTSAAPTDEPQHALGQVMAGRTVLVTADRRSAELSAALARRGAETRHAPALSMVPNEDDAALVAGTRDLVAHPPDVVVVTTGVGFRGWVEAATVHGLADELLAVLRRARLVARGPKARGAIQAAGLHADWVAESETSAEIADVLLGEGVAGLRIAVQHHGAGADGVDELFTEAGADVVSLVVYRWGPPPDEAALRASVHAAARGEIDAVVFTSAPGAEAWLAAAEAEGVGDAVVARFASGAMVAAAVGPVTARPLVQRGAPTLQPDRGRLGALVRTLVGHYEQAGLRVPETGGTTVITRSRRQEQQ